MKEIGSHEEASHRHGIAKRANSRAAKDEGSATGNGTLMEPLIDNADHGSHVVRLLLVGLALLGLVGAFLVLPPEQTRIVTLWLLAILSIIGVFFLLAVALGVVSLSSRQRGDGFAKAFVDGLTHGTLVTDWEGRIIYANRKYGELTGAQSASEVGTIERVFSSSEDASEVVYRLNRQVRAGESGTEEFRMLRPVDGSARDHGGPGRWYRLSARQLEHAARRKPLLVWEMSDVTQERQQQEHVFLELQNAIDYLDHAPAGFYSAQPDGRIVYLNATLADWLGVDLATFSPGDLNTADLIVGDGGALLQDMAREPGETQTLVADLDLARTNGQSLPVRVYHKVPVNADGAPGATRTLVLNRSAGEGISEELRVAQVRFARFFNNTPIAIASFSDDGVLQEPNAPFRKLFAPVFARKGSAPARLSDFAGETERAAMESAFAAALEGRGEIDHVDSVLHDAPSTIDGEEFSIRFFFSPVAGSEDDEEGDSKERVIVCAVEMTEQKALERQMAQGQKMQAVGQLAGGIAHDFNNVLTAIIGFSDLLLANHRHSDPSFPDLMQIKQNANRAAALVRQLLAFSRRQTLRPQILSISDVLADLRMLLARVAGDRITLDIHHGRDLWPLKADIGQFEQVIVNLCVNARDAINDTKTDGGTITIRTSNRTGAELRGETGRREIADGDYVEVAVSDTGTGIDPEIIEKIFEPFFSTKEVGQGTGLGLSMVYGIIKQSGGYIYPESEIGKGTTFRIILPRHVPTDAELSAAEGVAIEKKSEKARDLAGNATIVFVEDEDAVRAVGSRTLASRGYDVHEAENGAIALEIIEELGDAVDLVVSDVVMPEMDGPTLLDSVRKKGMDVPFIFASGYAEDAFEKNLPEQQQGKFGFIPKPYSLKQLATAVKEALDAKDRA